MSYSYDVNIGQDQNKDPDSYRGHPHRALIIIIIFFTHHGVVYS